MSYRRMDEVIERCAGTAVPPLIRWVFTVLARCENAKTGRCHPSVATLCRLTGYRRSSVLAALSYLKRVRAVVVVRRGPRTSRYAFQPTVALEVQSLDLKADEKRSKKTQKRSSRLDEEVQNLDPEQGRNREENREGASDAPEARRHRAHARRRPLPPLGGSDRPHTTPSEPARKGTSGERPSDPAVRRLLTAFCDTRRATIGQAYLVVRGRDGARLREALRLYDEATIERAVPPYFSDRRSIERVGASVPLFVSRIATLAGEAPVEVENYTGRGQAARAAALGEAGAATKAIP